MIRMNSLKHVDTHMGELISDLQKLIQQPSVSAKMRVLKNVQN